ncbi:MAG: hypothetical protein JWQ53_367, partial [Klenkia sp.]|nr:hypothetical protein [Klenkia sp.]
MRTADTMADSMASSMAGSTAGSMADPVAAPTPQTRTGRAARVGVPTFTLPHESAQATARTARPVRGPGPTVPAAASTGVAELLRG